MRRPASVLGGAEHPRSTRQLQGLLHHFDRAGVQVDASARQCCQLAPAQRAIGGEQHENAPTWIHRGGERVDLSDRGDRPLGRTFGGGTFDDARILHDQLVLDGRVQDRAQQPVALRRGRRCEGALLHEVGEPDANLGRRQLRKLPAAERRDDVVVELASVQLDRADAQLVAMRQPPVGVGLERDLAAARVDPATALLVGAGEQQRPFGVGLRTERTE